MSVTLLEVLAAAQARRSSLVGETIGYLVLAVADQVVDAPRRVTPDSVQVTQDGAVRIQSSTACSSAEAESDLRSLLGELLVASRVTAGPLGRLATREHPGGMGGWVRALEAALVPINRAAGRRALGRIHRETQRAIEQGHIDPPSFELASSRQAGHAVPVAPPEPLGRSDEEPDSPCSSAELEPSLDPVLEVSGWVELDDDLDEVLLTEPPTARLTHCTAPLPPVVLADHILVEVPGYHTQPLPPVRPNAVGDSEESHTAPLASAPPVPDPSGPETEPLAEPESPCAESVQPIVLSEVEPLELGVEEAGEDDETSVELGDYVAAAAGSRDPRPDFQPVPVARRTFPWSGAQAAAAAQIEGDHSTPGPTEQAEWVELEELEKSAPPPLVWLRHDEAGPRPTGVVEALLADFDGDQERLQLALELLGRAPPEAATEESPPAEGSEWEFDLGLCADLGRPDPVMGTPVPPPDPAALWRAPRVFGPVQSDVDELLGRFSISAVRSHPDLCRYLTEIAGLDRTPPPPPLTGQPIVPVGALPHARSGPAERGTRAVQAVWSWLETAPDDEDPRLGPGEL